MVNPRMPQVTLDHFLKSARTKLDLYHGLKRSSMHLWLSFYSQENVSTRCRVSTKVTRSLRKLAYVA